MMLRTLPARSGFLWVLLACISLAGCTRHPKYSLQTEAALERLDAELSRKDRYQQWRQAQNDSLRREVARARNAGDRAWRLFAVSQNYVTYQLDSAAYTSTAFTGWPPLPGRRISAASPCLPTSTSGWAAGSWGLPKNFSAG